MSEPAAENQADEAVNDDAQNADQQPQDARPDAPKPSPPKRDEPRDESDADRADRLQAELAKVRREAAGHRTAKQRAADDGKAEQAQQIAKLLGLVKGDEQIDPEVLQQQLAGAQREAKQARVALSVFQSAAGAGADPSALLDSASFQAKVGDFDPSADDFTEQVKTAITDAVRANPRLRAEVPQAGGSGGFEGNGKRDTTPRTPKSLHDAVAAAYAR